MGFQCMIRGCSERRGSYRRLCASVAKPQPRRLWLRRVKGKAVVSFRLVLSSKRLKWMRFSILVVTRRLSKVYAEVLSAMRVDAVYPTINFSSQWGLPVVLSHQPVVARRSPTVPLRGKPSLS